jgi:hypothetical protein
MKVYRSKGMVLVPAHWLEAARADQRSQAYLIAVASTKNDLDRMLSDAGAFFRIIDQIRLAGDARATPLGNPARALIDARIIDCEHEGLWAHEAFRVGGIVVQVRGRTADPVARWVRAEGLTMRAERLTGTQAAGGESVASEQLG